MVARTGGVNGARLNHDQRHNRIGRLVHDVHDTPETLRVRRDAGKGIGSPSPTFRVQKNGIRFVSGPGFAHRLAGAGDGGSLCRPIFAARALRLQCVVASRHAPRFADESVFIGSESTEVSLLSVDVHGSGRSPVSRIVPFNQNAEPAVLRAFGFFARVTLRTIDRPRAGQPSHVASKASAATFVRGPRCRITRSSAALRSGRREGE